MIYLVPLFIEIVLLFLLSQNVSKTLSRFMSINLMSFILAPGVIIHELSHLFVATILFVPVGDMEFSPKRSGDGIKLGSIAIAKTDPIRRTMIGFAPIFVGLVVVVGIIYLFSANLVFLQKNVYVYISAILLFIYSLFAISNTMFSSGKDMEGAIEVLITLLIVFVAAYLLGIRIPFSYLKMIFSKEVVGVIQKSIFFLLGPIAIDLFLLGIVRLVTGSRSRT